MKITRHPAGVGRHVVYVMEVRVGVGVHFECHVACVVGVGVRVGVDVHFECVVWYVHVF